MELSIADLAKNANTSNSNPASVPPESLAGRRIGFYTPYAGMGGSEVLVADALEAACGAGASVVCWSLPQAAIRTILASRTPFINVEHRDWLAVPPPRQSAEPIANDPAQPQRSHSEPGNSSFRSRLAQVWRALAPTDLKRCVSFQRTAAAFERELNRAHLDLLFVQVNVEHTDPVSVAGQRAGIPVANCYHASWVPRRGRLLARWTEERAQRAVMHAGDVAIHTAFAVRDEWCRRYRYPASRTSVIYNGVDELSLPTREQTRSELGLCTDQFVFCLPGRIAEMKGHCYLIEALRLKRDRFRDVRVIICGDGIQRDSIQKQCLEANLDGIVKFLGWRQDLPAILHAADCVVLPSICAENLSVAVIEGLMAGTPAIVTSIGGMAEAVRHGETGLVVPPANASALAEAMLSMLEEDRQTREMGARAQADARQRFTRRRMMDEYVSLFVKMLDAGEQRRARATSLPATV